MAIIAALASAEAEAAEEAEYEWGCDGGGCRIKKQKGESFNDNTNTGYK